MTRKTLHPPLPRPDIEALFAKVKTLPPMTQKAFTLVVERGDAGLWFVHSPDLRAALFSGRTLAAALANAAEGLPQLHRVLRHAKANGEPYIAQQLAAFEAAQIPLPPDAAPASAP